jgi:hypothetical protein
MITNRSWKGEWGSIGRGLDGLRRFHAEFLGKLGCGPEEWLPIIHDARSVGVPIVFLYELTPYGLPIIAQKGANYNANQRGAASPPLARS